MKRKIISTIALLIHFLASSHEIFAQGEENIWMCSSLPFGGANYGLNLDSGPATFTYSSGSLGSIIANNALCDPTGAPLFYTSGVSKKVYDIYGNAMPNGSGLLYSTIGGTYSMPPLIVANPENANQSYIIHPKDGGLFYSIVDMSLNSGLGDVVQKNKPINGFGGVGGIATNSKVVAIQGCKNIWLVVRSKNVNEYRAYAISDTGFNTNPVISEVGNFPVAYYNGDVYYGRLKASPDGKMIAASCAKMYAIDGTAFSGGTKGGIELYAFEKCSGKLSDPVIIDSSQYFEGLCFSPDNTKLYASSEDKVFQFDVSLPSVSAITASKTLILTNPPIPVYSIWCGYYCDTMKRDIGDLKRGKDGRIYMGNNRPDQCINCLPSATTSTYHSINAPNLLGASSLPEINTVSFSPGSFPIGIDLPPDYASAPLKPDTFYNTVGNLVGCFADSFQLSANEYGGCYIWDNGSVERKRMINESGVYYVRYFMADCSYHIDTFVVKLVPLPVLKNDGYSCPNANQAVASVKNKDGDNTTFTYHWKNATGNVIKTSTSNRGDTATGLNAGLNYLQINTPFGCDTTIAFEVNPLPVPEASFSVDTIVCNNTSLYFQNTSTTPLQQWFFGDGGYSSEKNPEHQYKKGGDYQAQLEVRNIEGCTDTASVVIHVKELVLELRASDILVDRGTEVQLSTYAPEFYSVTGWQPSDLFPDQTAYQQKVIANITKTFTVTGKSEEYGCVSDATVTVTVEPFLLMPNAFSPNGDGLNDYFMPVITGDGYVLVSFMVFNRWGQAIYQGYGNTALKGWDGSYNGQSADMGTYFYQIQINNPSGKTVTKKGEVTLIR